MSHISGTGVELFGLRLGEMMAPAGVLRRGDPGPLVRVPVTMWVIRSSDGVVVVDTGTSAPGSAEAMAHGMPLSRADDEAPLAALGMLGIAATDVDWVVNTHLHWDHASNNGLFTRATTLVQESELAATLAPPPGHHAAYEADSHRMGAGDRLTPITGRHPVMPGVTLIPLPGHTPGSQGVLVETEHGRYVLVGDLCPTSPRRHTSAHLSGVLASEQDAAESLAGVMALGADLLGSHDPEIFRRSSVVAFG